MKIEVGAMLYVERFGSAEEYLLRMIHKKVKFSVPISLSVDFHADNSDDIPECATLAA